MEDIDYIGVIAQLQLENERLRHSLKRISELQDAAAKVPDMIGEIWYKATSNKYHLLVGIMIIYWAASLGFMFYDHFRGNA